MNTQRIYKLSGRKLVTLELPSARDYVVSGVQWGAFTTPLTPAYWKALAWLSESATHISRPAYSRSGILEETIFCLLGGYGIKAEVAHAYFEEIVHAGVLRESTVRKDTITNILAKPTVHNGKAYRYRFPNQKGGYISRTINVLRDSEPPKDDVKLRDWLLNLPGIGLKTAGWIVRNCLNSNDVAIIDVHLRRAGQIMRLFDSRPLASSSYSYFENRFLSFAKAIEVKASSLDMLIWENIRAAPLSLRNRPNM